MDYASFCNGTHGKTLDLHLPDGSGLVAPGVTNKTGGLIVIAEDDDTARVAASPAAVDESRIRVVKPRIGGGFGVKQEVLIEDICAHLTIATGRPVRSKATSG